MKTKRLSISLFLVLIFSYQSFSQTSGEENHFKDWILATGEMTYLNLSVAIGESLYLNNQIFSSFDFTSNIKTNFTTSFQWDNSNYFKNNFLHPNLGSFYFNSGRSNNLNFLEAFGLTVTGSLMWEGGLHSGPVSLNDVITTAYCGAVNGEILHRLYFPVCDINPFLGLLVSPVDFITDFVKYKPQKSASGNIYDIHLFSGLGYCFYPGIYGNGGLRIDYENLYGHKTKEFFDQFSVNLKGFYTYKEPGFVLKEEGLLYSWPLYFDLQNAKSLANFGLNLNYNIYYSDSFKKTTESTGLFYAQKVIFQKFSFAYSGQLNFIFLGITNSYNFGPEGKLNSEFISSYGNAGVFYSFQYLFLYDGKQFTDEPLNGFFNELSVYYEYPVKDYFTLGIQYDLLNCDNLCINQISLYIKKVFDFSGM